MAYLYSYLRSLCSPHNSSIRFVRSQRLNDFHWCIAKLVMIFKLNQEIIIISVGGSVWCADKIILGTTSNSASGIARCYSANICGEIVVVQSPSSSCAYVRFWLLFSFRVQQQFKWYTFTRRITTSRIFRTCLPCGVGRTVAHHALYLTW